MSSEPLLMGPIRLLGVTGFEDRKNDLVYCPPLQDSTKSSLVLFFPGDVQDFTENMTAHRDNKHHKQWNLDSTAQLLQNKFGDSHILVIKPSRMDFKTFSCFQNFVKSSQLGVPEHTPNNNALRHLKLLIENASSVLRNLSDEELLSALETSRKATDGEDSAVVSSPDGSVYQSNLNQLPLKLIAFSKGCVVLNQILYELHDFYKTRKDGYILDVIGRIRDMYWLDGGHSGGKNTWVTSKDVLETFSGLDINIHIHLTPYQIEDDRRPWIKKEEKSFSDTLRRMGCKIDRVVHFETIPPSLTTHFELLKTFR